MHLFYEVVIVLSTINLVDMHIWNKILIQWCSIIVFDLRCMASEKQLLFQHMNKKELIFKNYNKYNDY
jgi:hypothetical protein